MDNEPGSMYFRIQNDQSYTNINPQENKNRIPQNKVDHQKYF